MAGVLFIDRDTDRWAAVGTLLYFRLPAWGIGASFSTVQGLGVKVLYKL